MKMAFNFSTRKTFNSALRSVGLEYKIFQKLKKSLKDIVDNQVTDELYFYQCRVDELDITIRNLSKFLPAEDYVAELEILDLINETKYIKRSIIKQIKIEKNRINNIYNTILIACNIAPSWETFISSLQCHKIIQSRSRYVHQILEQLRYVYLAEQHRHNLITKLQRDRLYEFEQNRRSYNVLELDPDIEYVTDEGEFDDDEDTEVVRRYIRKRKPRWDYSNVLYGPRPPPPRMKSRNVDLYKRLHAIIEACRQRRLGRIGRFKKYIINKITSVFRSLYDSYFLQEVFDIMEAWQDRKNRKWSETIEMTPVHPEAIMDQMMIEWATFQMDAHGEESISTKEAGNVDIVEVTEGSNATTAPPSIPWHRLVSADVCSSYSPMTDRWIEAATFTWDKSEKGTLILSKTLPNDALLASGFKLYDLPNGVPFRVHRYWRGDMEIKIHINSNKFQIGQLQCIWFYEPVLDSKIKLRVNPYSFSQTHHCLISAGCSNEATLYIPFKHHMPMISCKVRKDLKHILAVGELAIGVLNPLSVPTGGPAEAYGTVFIRFVNSEFTGQLHGTIDAAPQPQLEGEELAHHQMDTALKIATSVLTNAIAPNMDNPPDVRPPSYIVPTATHSWSNGTNIVSPLHSLRLDATGQTGTIDPTTDEMSISSVVNKFGLVSTFLWEQSYSAGQLIKSFDAAPLLSKDSYTKVDNTGDYLDMYYVPPVGVISSLFQYWRGSLEFRFDIIASQFHTGRLMIGYVPGATDKSVINLTRLRSGPHIVISINENTQFTYVVPYIADRPFWNRRYAGNYTSAQVDAPSRLYIYVLNPLVPMQNVVNKVFINMYMRAGPDFEVAIPVQPSIGLGFNPQIAYPENDYVHALEGYAPYYCGYVNRILGGDVLVMRYGTTSNAYCYFTSKFLQAMTEGAGYYYSIRDESKAPTYKDEFNKMQKVKYIVILWDGTPNADMSNAIAFPVATAVIANYVTKHYSSTKDLESVKTSLLPSKPGTTENTWSDGNPYWTPIKTTTKTETATFEGEREEAQNILAPTQLISPTNSGQLFYGERFVHLKDYMRRYQLYAVNKIKLNNDKCCNRTSIVYPILPQGLELNIGTNDNINEFFNRCRDGPIPIILSGYRYYRGGLRFRVVLSMSSDFTVWIQHRPDRRINALSPLVITELQNAQSLFNHGYAYYMQSGGVNSVIEFEIPFYQNSAFGLLQRPELLTTNEGFYYGLGDLTIGFDVGKSRKEEECCISLYYAVADDFVASTFQGFPPIVILDEIVDRDPNKVVADWEEIALPQMGWFNNITEGIKSSVTKTVEEKVKEEVGAASSKMEEVLTDIKDNLKNTSAVDMLNNSTTRNFFSNLAHIIANFNWKSMCIGIVSFLVEICAVTYNMMTSLIEQLLQFFTSLKIRVTKSGNEPNPPDIAEEAQEVATHNMKVGEETSTYEAATGVITLLWTSICSLVSLKSVKPSNVKEWASFLTKDIKNVMSSSNVVFVFLRNILSVLTSMKEKIFGIVDPTYKKIQLLEEQVAPLRLWFENVIRLDNPQTFDKYKYVPKYRQEVAACYLKGSIYYKLVFDISDRDIAIKVSQGYDKIRKLFEKCVEISEDLYVRREPFVVWQYGGSGLGKSTLTTPIILELLKSQNIEYSVAPIYNHEPSSEFWDSCTGNPAMVVDDMFAVQEGDMFERQLGLLFSVVSPVVLCPPKAHLEDKGKPYSPEILWINSNYDFIRPNNINQDAIHRRRHVLVKVEPSNTKIPNCPHCSGTPIVDVEPHWLADFHHLQFRIHANPKTNMGMHNTYGTPLSYTQYLAYLSDKFKQVRTKQSKMYKERLEQIYNVIDDSYTTDWNEIIKEENIKRKLEERVTKVYKNSIAGCLSDLKQSYFERTSHFKKILKKCLPKGFHFWLQWKVVNMNPFDSELEEDAIVSEEEPTAVEIDMEGFNALKKELETATCQMMSIDDKEDDVEEISLCRKLCKSEYNYMEFVELFNDNKVDINKRIRPIFLDSNIEKNSLGVLTALAQMERMESTIVDDFVFMARINENEHKNTLPDLVSLYHNPEMREFITLSFGVHRGNCFHLNYNPADYIAFNGTLYTNDGKHEVFSTCSAKRCFYKSIAMKHCVYMYVTFYNDKFKYLISSASPSVKVHIPKEYINLSSLNVPPDSWWKDKISNLYYLSQVMMSRLYPTWVSFVEKLTYAAKWIKDVLTVLAPLMWSIGWTAASVYGCVSVIRTGQELRKQELENDLEIISRWSRPQAHGYADKQNVNLNAKVTIAKERASAQQSLPQFDVVLDRIKKNMFKITAEYDGRTLSCTGVVIRDRELLLLRHFLEEMDVLPPHTVYYGEFTWNSIRVDFNYREMERTYYDIRNSDGTYASNMVVVYLPIKFNQSKDITRFIATARDHEIMTGDGVMYQNNGMIHQNLNIIREKTRPLIIQESGNSSKVVLQDMYTYRLQGRGMCGSLILARGLEKPIIGIHVAGVERGNIRGVAEPLVYETFNDIPKQEVAYKTSIIPDLLDSEFANIKPETLIFPLGCIEQKDAIFQNNKSRIIPSVIQGIYPVETEPAPLSLKDPRHPPGYSPLTAGIEHMGKPPRDFPKNDIKEAAFDLERIIIQNVKPIRNTVGIVSDSDAIVGNPNIPGFEPLEWSTSPGWPLKYKRDSAQQSGKKWLFDLDMVDGKYVLKGIHPELQKQLAYARGCRARGIKPMTVYIDCLKDAVLPVEKCKVPGKTRVFSISPIQFTIDFKKYFLDFMASYQHARFSAEHGIGINVNSYEWTQLAGLLQEKGNKIVCGDYKNFGPGLMLSVAQAAFDIILNWYSFYENNEDNNKIRRIMVSEILGAYHLVNTLVYTAPCGIPSGSPITAPLNSLVNSIYIRIAWKYTTNLNYCKFRDYCNIVTYGDDVCINISDEICEMFNTVTIGDFFDQYRIVFTDYDKQGISLKWRTLQDASFLKCKFNPHPYRKDVWLSALEKVSIQSTLNWIHERNNKLQATIENCEQAIMNAHGHGEIYYNELINKINKALTELNATCRYSSWRELDQERYGVAHHQMDNPGYDGWEGEVENVEYHDWYNVNMFLRTLKTMQRINFSLQVERTAALDMLNNMFTIDPPVSQNIRFPYSNKYVSSCYGGWHKLILNLRMSLVYKENIVSNPSTNKLRNDYNDSLVSYYTILDELIQNTVNQNYIINRNKFETYFNVTWHD